MSVSECAKALNMTSRAIQGYIKTGKLSASKNERGRYEVDKSEFYRVFPDASVGERERKNDTKRDESTVSVKELEITYLKEQVRILSEQISEYKTRESKLLEVASSTTKLLTHDKETTKKKKGWFGR